MTDLSHLGYDEVRAAVEENDELMRRTGVDPVARRILVCGHLGDLVEYCNVAPGVALDVILALDAEEAFC